MLITIIHSMRTRRRRRPTQKHLASSSQGGHVCPIALRSSLLSSFNLRRLCLLTWPLGDPSKYLPMHCSSTRNKPVARSARRCAFKPRRSPSASASLLNEIPESGLHTTIAPPSQQSVGSAAPAAKRWVCSAEAVILKKVTAVASLGGTSSLSSNFARPLQM